MRTLLTVLIVSASLLGCDIRYEAEPVKPELVSTEEAESRHAISGEQLFIACQGCHSIEAGAAHRVGPNLYGMMGQPAATRPGYTYSEALKNSGITWTDAMLAAWIVNCEVVVEGTWMAYSNVVAVDELMSLVDYINQASSAAPDDTQP